MNSRYIGQSECNVIIVQHNHQNDLPAFLQLCPRYSGTLTPTVPAAIRLWETLVFLNISISILKVKFSSGLVAVWAVEKAHCIFGITYERQSPSLTFRCFILTWVTNGTHLAHFIVANVLLPCCCSVLFI